VRLRPPILFTVAFWAGLATGLLHFGAPGWVIGISLAVALLLRRSLSSVLCAAVLLGRLSGEIAWMKEGGTCATQLPPGPLRLSLRLLEPVDPEGGRLEV
jgi:hypothetical protein